MFDIFFIYFIFSYPKNNIKKNLHPISSLPPPREQPQQEVVEQQQPATQYTPMEALKEVVKLSLHNDGLARGLFETVKALDRGTAQLCVLSQSCNEAAYKKLITALCKERNIPLIEVPDNKILGEYAGLARCRPDGTIVKYMGCSSIAIKSWGVDSAARAAVLAHMQNSTRFQ